MENKMNPYEPQDDFDQCIRQIPNTMAVCRKCGHKMSMTDFQTKKYCENCLVDFNVDISWIRIR